MKIRLKSILAGPWGSHQPGSVIEVDAETGGALVAGGYGTEITPSQQRLPIGTGEAENAALESPETADVKTARRGRRPR